MRQITDSSAAPIQRQECPRVAERDRLGRFVAPAIEGEGWSKDDIAGCGRLRLNGRAARN